MTWFRVDDNLAFHPKAIAAGNPALGLWVRAGSWAGQQLSDGFVPSEIARSLGTRSQVDRLVDVGLWLPSSGGFEFHQFAERNPTRLQVESRRDAGAKRLQRWREERRRDGETE